MKSCSKIKILAALLLSLNGVAAAQDSLLAETETSFEGNAVKAELWGDMLPGGYAHNLLLLVKDGGGNIVTAYAPDVKGGYHCLLQPVRVRQDGCQVMLSAGQGGWQAPTEYRVLEISKKDEIRELFTAADSMGVIRSAALDGGRLALVMDDGETVFADLPEEPGEQACGGMEYGVLSALTAHDLDGDGVQELLSVQNIKNGRRLLAEAGAVWTLGQNGWSKGRTSLSIVPASPKNDRINSGCEIKGGVILPRRILLPGQEAAYPQASCADAAVQNNINGVIEKEAAGYLSLFYSGGRNMAFSVMQSDENIISIQIISGGDAFSHHNINIDPDTGGKLELGDILDLRSPDLLPLLKLLRSNDGVTFENGIPDEWYMQDGMLFLMERHGDQDEVSGYSMENLHKFLKNSKWTHN